MAGKSYKDGERNVVALIQLIEIKIATMPLAEIDYVSIYSYPTLAQIENIVGTAIIAVAVKFGKTRLIDNEILK